MKYLKSVLPFIFLASTVFAADPTLLEQYRTICVKLASSRNATIQNSTGFNASELQQALAQWQLDNQASVDQTVSLLAQIRVQTPAPQLQVIPVPTTPINDHATYIEYNKALSNNCSIVIADSVGRNPLEFRDAISNWRQENATALAAVAAYEASILQKAPIVYPLPATAPVDLQDYQEYCRALTSSRSKVIYDNRNATPLIIRKALQQWETDMQSALTAVRNFEQQNFNQ